METSLKEKILAQRRIFYNNIQVQYEIVKALHHREMSIITAKTEEKRFTTRYIVAFSVAYLKKHFERFYFYEVPRNLYMSVATLKNIPIFSYNMEQRRKEPQYIEFNKNYKNYVDGYDLFLDVDFQDYEDLKKNYWQVLKINEVFTEYKLPFWCMNSSLKGIHFHIPSSYMPFEWGIDKLLEILNQVAYNFKGIYSADRIDTSIFDIKRLCRCAYSYSCDGSICLPLDDNQILNFKPKMVEMENVLKTIQIRNRGLLVRNVNLGEETLKNNVVKFLNDFS